MFLDFIFKNKRKNDLISDKRQNHDKIKIVRDKSLRVENECKAVRKGELGEYKIDIQLSQLPKEYRYLSDLLVENPKSSTGYSQIDHVIITPYGFFVIETKNYQGAIYGEKDRNTWLVNGKFKMMNPLNQNYGHIQALKSLIDVKYHQSFTSVISFTKRCTFKVDEELRKIHSKELVIYDIELTEFINRKIAVLKIQFKNPIFTKEDIEGIYNSFLNSNITDELIRKTHIDNIKNKQERNNSRSIEPICLICKTPVSDKVKSFCLSNERFQGKVYCYKHQKNLQN